MMFSPVSLQLCCKKNRISQKCVIPAELFVNSNLRIGDYVILESLNQIYICQLFISNHINVFVDDTVTSTKYSKKVESSLQYITFPDNIFAINASKFDHVLIKIVFRDNVSTLNCSKVMYEAIAHEILSKYVITRNCTVNCSALALSVNIKCIVVVNAFPADHLYGKLTRSSVVEILDIMSSKQVEQIEKFRNLNIGGINGYSDLLKWNFFQPGRAASVLVSGPAGCGKSCVVKKFSSEIKCFLVYIDGLKKEEITTEKCDIYKSQISNYLGIFPDKFCVLFIDDIDVMIPCDIKTFLHTLVITLIEDLKKLDVFIMATAVHKQNVHHSVSSLFEREISMGIPTRQERKEMIQALTKSLHCNIDYDEIALTTPGFIAHDISKLIKETLESKWTINSEDTMLTTEDLKETLTKISPSVLKSSAWNLKVKPVYWEDIGGVFHVKEKLRMCVELPLKNPAIFKQLHLPCPRGILLFGPPGCCKTTLARGLATECNANFFAANPAQIYSPYVGESEKNITELFYHARLAAPSIIFLDELDTLVTRRRLDSKSQGVAERVLSTLLNELDGFGTTLQYQSNINMQKLMLESKTKEVDNEWKSNDVIVVAATNRPDLIDGAMLRPGRFDVILYVPPPNTEERESILKTLTKPFPVKDIDFKSIAERTNLFSGADLKNLSMEAGMNVLRGDKSDAEYVTTECFDEALKVIRPSITRQQLEIYEKLSMKYDPVSNRTGEELRSGLF